MTLNDVIEFAKENNIDFNSDIIVVDYDPRFALSKPVHTEYLSQISAGIGKCPSLYLYADCLTGEAWKNKVPGKKFMEKYWDRRYYFEKEVPETKPNLVNETKLETKLKIDQFARDLGQHFRNQFIVGEGIKKHLYEKGLPGFVEDNALLVNDHVTYIGYFETKDGIKINVHHDSHFSSNQIYLNFKDDQLEMLLRQEIPNVNLDVDLFR